MSAPTRWVELALVLSITTAAVLACHRTLLPRFAHDTHLNQAECGTLDKPCLTCLSCHSSQQTIPSKRARNSQEPVLPEASRCQGCHGPGGGQFLASSREASQRRQPVAHSIRFSHAPHLAMAPVRGQCIFCHAGAVDSTENSLRSLETPIFPSMERCLSCHEHRQQFDKGVCTPCHDPLEVTRLLPQTFARHDLAWKRHHEWEAQMQPEVCGSCHTQQQCDNCHSLEQTVTPAQRDPGNPNWDRTHPADFITRHAIEAASQPGTCLSCHAPATCESCHLARGISANSLDPRSPHPVGWAFGDPGGPAFHGRAARRELVSCAACHDQGPATNCIQCHKVGGPGGNPHPRGNWTSASSSSGMCRYCHER